jgi:hypothetical protein
MIVCVLNGELLLFSYSEAWSVWNPAKTALAWWHATAIEGWARATLLGVRAHPGCGHALASSPGHRLCQVGWWLGLGPSRSGARPKFGMQVGFSIYSLPAFLLYAFYFVPFAWFSTCIQI